MTDVESMALVLSKSRFVATVVAAVVKAWAVQTGQEHSESCMMDDGHLPRFSDDQCWEL